MSARVTRLAENEAAFREANERIGRTGRRFGIEQPLPFLCECERRLCTQVIHVLPHEYEVARQNPRAFLYAEGHELGTGTESRVVKRGDGYLIVEKLGLAGEIAEATNPREPAT